MISYACDKNYQDVGLERVLKKSDFFLDICINLHYIETNLISGHKNEYRDRVNNWSKTGL